MKFKSKYNIFDWIIYISICLILSFLPIVYIKKALEKGSLKIEFELFNTNEIITYLWFSIFLIFLVPICVLTFKNIKIKQLSYKIKELNEFIKNNEQQQNERLNYFEEEKKILLKMEKQKSDEIINKYESQISNFKKQIKNLSAENENLKKIKTNIKSGLPQYQSAEQNIFIKYNTETINYLNEIKNKIQGITQYFKFENDLQIVENNEDLNKIINSIYLKENQNLIIYFSNIIFDKLYNIISKKNFMQSNMSIIFTVYYEDKIIELLKYLYSQNFTKINLFYLNEPGFDFLIIENELLFINPFRDETPVYYYFNPRGVTEFSNYLSKKKKFKFEIVSDILIEITKTENAVILRFLNENYILVEEKINLYINKLQNNLKNNITFISLKMGADENYFLTDIIADKKNEMAF